MVILRGERVLLRPGRPEDVAKLVEIRNEPEVAHRWGNVDIEEEISEEFIDVDNAFVMEVEREIVGAIQYHEESDPMYRLRARTSISPHPATERVWAQKRLGSLPAISLRSVATIASRSIRRPT